MTDKTYNDPSEVFDFSKCETCGECLSKCSYMSLTPKRAAAEMRNLKDGRPSVVLDLCAGCWSCDPACPNGCRPYSLIRTRWGERYAEEGLPEKARNLIPTEFPNFRASVPQSRAQKSILEKIKNPPDSDEVLFTGCNTLVIAETLQSRVFDSLPAFGSFDYCCGEMFYRMGLFDAARQSALKMRRVFSGLNARRIVFPCAACMSMLSNIYPQEFGVKFDFEAVLITDWFAEKFDSGELEVRAPLNMTVSVQDSCHLKVMDERMYDSPRALLKRLGAKVVEMKLTKKESGCCGVAAGCSRYAMIDLARAGFRRTLESAVPRSDATVCYCNGCLLTLAGMRNFAPWAPPPLPLIQLVQKAIGENPDLGLSAKRSRQVFAGIAVAAAPAMLSRDRFFLSEIV